MPQAEARARSIAVAILLLYMLPLAARAQIRDTVIKTAHAPRQPDIAAAVHRLTIGVREGPSEYAFTSVSDIALRSDGFVVILDASMRSRPSVRMFDARGRFIREIGRQGEGPGEYRSPTAVAFAPDGRLMLLDRLNRRINVYSSSGEIAATWSVPSYNVTGGLGGRMRIDPAGIIAIRFTVTTRPRKEAVVRIRFGGAVLDTLLAPALPDPYPRITVARNERGIRVSATVGVPYAPRAFWEWSPLGYFVAGVSSRYVIDLQRPDHGIASADPQKWSGAVTSIRLPSQPVQVGRAERNDQQSFIDHELAAMKGERDGSLPEVPRVKPFFKWFRVGDDGRIWVTVHVPSERYTQPQVKTPSGTLVRQVPWREPHVIDVFEPNGTYIGRVRFPHGFIPKTFRDDEVWGVVRDEFDVEYVQRYRIDWQGRR